jgi:hypothetical protein
MATKKGCTRLEAASDKVYKLPAHDQRFSTGTLGSSTTKIGRHDIGEILLKVALNTINQSIYMATKCHCNNL